METQEIMTRLTEVFRETFADPQLEISATTTSDDIAYWDSFNHVNLIMMTEDKFKVSFALSELKSLKNVGALVDLIRSKTVQPS